MNSKRGIERGKVERQVTIRPLTREVSTLRVTSIDSTAAGVGFSSMIPLKVGTAIAVDSPDMNKNTLMLCNVKHCTPIKAGKFHVGAQIEQSQAGNLTTTRIPESWWNAN